MFAALLVHIAVSALGQCCGPGSAYDLFLLLILGNKLAFDWRMVILARSIAQVALLNVRDCFQ